MDLESGVGVGRIDIGLLGVLGRLMLVMVVLLFLVWTLTVMRPIVVDWARGMKEARLRVYHLELHPVDSLGLVYQERKRRLLQLEPIDCLVTISASLSRCESTHHHPPPFWLS